MDKSDLISKIITECPAKRAHLYTSSYKPEPENQKYADTFRSACWRHGVDPDAIRPYKGLISYDFTIEQDGAGPSPATIINNRAYGWKT